MKILLNHTLRSIRDNLGQFVIILLTTTVVAAMFFVTVTIGDLFTNLQTSLKSRLGNAMDVTVDGTIFSEARFDEFAKDNPEVEYIEKYLQLGSLFRPDGGSVSKAIMVEATNLAEFSARHGKELVIYQSYEFSYEYPEVWIGRSFAEENNIKAGDTVEIYVELYQTYRTLTVNYIFENFGVFANNVVNNVLVDFNTLGNKGMLTLACVKLTDGVDKTGFVDRLTTHMGNPDLNVGDSVDYKEINRIVGSNQTLLNVALVFVTALMLFILFTSYLVVAKNRIGELMLFKAVGATNGQITALMLVEGILYGFIGAIIGVLIGRVGMGIAVDKVIPNFPDAISYQFSDYFLSVLFGTFVSAVAAFFPMVRVSRQSIRQNTSGGVKSEKRRTIIPLIISSIGLIASLILLILLPGAALPLTIVLIVFVALTVFLAMPYIVKMSSALFKGGKEEAKLASISMKRNPLSHTLSGMVGSVIVFTFIVVSIVNVIIGAIRPYNERFNADFVVESISETDMRDLNDSLSKVHGVMDASVYYYDDFVKQTAKERVEYKVYGADNSTALKWISEGIDQTICDRFDAELNPVIISYDISTRFGLKIGDTLKLTLGTKEKDGKTLYDDFTVVGLDYTTTSNDRVMLIRNSSFRVDGKPYVPQKSMIFLQTNKDVPNADLYNELRDNLENELCYILRFDDWAYATSVGIHGIVLLLNILQIIVCAVALVGVVNLTIVTMIDRKREFNIYRSVGLNGKRQSILALCESIVVGVAGLLTGLVLSLIINRLVPVFAQVIDRYIQYEVFPLILPLIAAIGFVVYVGIYTLTAGIRFKKDAIERNRL